MADLATSGYVNSTPGSQTWFERARQVLPGGVSYAIRDLAPYPFYVARAAGSRLYDVDGNEYTDYWCGHGTMILGHAPEAVVKAAGRQIALGSHFGFAHPLEVEVAEMVTRLVPSAEAGLLMPRPKAIVPTSTRTSSLVQRSWLRRRVAVSICPW